MIEKYNEGSFNLKFGYKEVTLKHGILKDGRLSPEDHKTVADLLEGFNPSTPEEDQMEQDIIDVLKRSDEAEDAFNKRMGQEIMSGSALEEIRDANHRFINMQTGEYVLEGEGGQS